MIVVLCLVIVVAAAARMVVLTQNASRDEARIEELSGSIESFLRNDFGEMALRELINITAEDRNGLLLDSSYSSGFSEENPLRFDACYTIEVKRGGEDIADMKLTWNTAGGKVIICSCCNDPLEFTYDRFEDALAHVVGMTEGNIASHTVRKQPAQT
jgi:hypothetical protein